MQTPKDELHRTKTLLVFLSAIIVRHYAGGVVGTQKQKKVGYTSPREAVRGSYTIFVFFFLFVCFFLDWHFNSTDKKGRTLTDDHKPCLRHLNKRLQQDGPEADLVSFHQKRGWWGGMENGENNT